MKNLKHGHCQKQLKIEVPMCQQPCISWSCIKPGTAVRKVTVTWHNGMVCKRIHWCQCANSHAFLGAVSNREQQSGRSLLLGTMAWFARESIEHCTTSPEQSSTVQAPPPKTAKKEEKEKELRREEKRSLARTQPRGVSYYGLLDLTMQLLLPLLLPVYDSCTASA